MDGQIFTISKIEGEYAYLIPAEGGDEIFIAIALLPPGADIGMKVKCESFSFSLCDC